MESDNLTKFASSFEIDTAMFAVEPDIHTGLCFRVATLFG